MASQLEKKRRTTAVPVLQAFASLKVLVNLESFDSLFSKAHLKRLKHMVRIHRGQYKSVSVPRLNFGGRFGQ